MTIVICLKCGKRYIGDVSDKCPFCGSKSKVLKNPKKQLEAKP